MKRLLFLLPLLALTSACNSETYIVRTYDRNSKAERQVCADYETKDVGHSYGFMDAEGSWTMTRCTAYRLVDETTVVGYISPGNTLVKCKVSREFYDHYAEDQPYEIPRNQCRVISPEEHQ